MPVEVYRDNREASRSAVLAHAGFGTDSDLRIARFSENVDVANVLPGATYHSACLVLSGGMIRLDQKTPIIAPGSVTVEPTWFEGSFTNDVQTDWISVYVRAERMTELAQDLIPGGHEPDLLRVEGAADPVLAVLLRSAATALLRAETISRIELDGWAQVIGAHLLRLHTNRPVDVAKGPGRLSPRALKLLIEAIEEDLDGDLTLANLARILDVGTSHLSVGFRSAMGRTIHQYILERRVDRARDLLEASETPLADIAFSVGFASQSHMTAVFRRHLGTTPGAYRRMRRN
ncbi:MAG: AraC family transcriptional regulator [Pseudomonadota bacterium]